MAKPKWVRPQQAADRTGASTRQIQRWAARGWVLHTRTLGGHLRIDSADLDRAIKEATNHEENPDERDDQDF